MRKRGFRTTDGSIQLRLEPYEREVLADLLGQLSDLLGPAPDRVVLDRIDPLAQLVGIAERADRPSDPVLLRLLPDAYWEDDAASADFRRFTEAALRRDKVRNAQAALASLQNLQRKQTPISAEQARAWMLALNDIRLALGVKLCITQQDEDADISQRPAVYEFLTWLQSTCIDALQTAEPPLR